ncbi:hypothetical protein QYM36_009657 [Artemia franciscana]|uniref:Uncharacterized protein n=1 Tax=Artemia franciscana TaxID=6661 RepID=A0AA88HMF0_ARTSF|nr:hypothetical protein QYM36_009657 [Artemia franciscana]
MESEPLDRNMILPNSNLLIYGFLQNGQPVYITAPSFLTETQIQLSPINYPPLNHLPDLSPMRIDNRFPESSSNDPDFPPLPQMETWNENLSAINPFAAEGIITNNIEKANAAAEHLASIVSVEDPFVEEAIAQKSKVKHMSQIDNNTPYNGPFSLH